MGPSLGGALAQPCLHYPALFSAGSIFEKFPYLLPNLVCTAFVIMGVIIGVLFLEETHEEKRHRRDPGLEAGRWLLSKIWKCKAAKQDRCEKAGDLSEIQPLIDDQSPPGYRTTECSPQIPTAKLADPQESLSLDCTYISNKVQPTTNKTFTKQVILNILGYGVLA